ncbi:MAG: biotin--[acetyl-CoA-carboxylase] ligase [Anaerolineaceae bacterium]|nr:biotin--[acetyl-CoA-carboxylase] ligase [Anaerolineaceae bacterium]
MLEESLRIQLADLPIPEIHFFETIGSTNDEALAWSETGAADGCLVIADTQTKGRGRLNRQWITRPGAALAFSLILRPKPEEISHLFLFSPLGGLALCQALSKGLGLAAQIKWPNDVLLNKQKVAGILVESFWSGEIPQSIILGIGVNVAPEAVPPPNEVMYPATSVEQIYGKPVDRFNLLHDLLESLFAWRVNLTSDQFFKAWEDYLAFRGEWVRVDQPGLEPITGQILGINENGNLRLLQNTGQEINVYAGDIRLRPADKNQ